mgnify:CR=1 FL=1
MTCHYLLSAFACKVFPLFMLCIINRKWNNRYFSISTIKTNYKVHSYDTNKLTNFLINDFSWESNKFFTKLGTTNQILASFKNLNYETKNIENYKKDTTSEFHGALGYFSEINLKKRLNTATHLLKPKMLIRYSPGSMRKENDGSRLNPSLAFDTLGILFS